MVVRVGLGLGLELGLALGLGLGLGLECGRGEGLSLPQLNNYNKKNLTVDETLGQPQESKVQQTNKQTNHTSKLLILF